MVTDRPDQTESAEVVPKGTFQLEAGWTITRDDGDVGLETQEVPQTLLRIGLSRRVELRVEWGGYVSTEEESASGLTAVDGASDGAVGVKVLLRPGEGRRPQIALLVGTSLPVGAETLTSDAADPDLRLLLAHDLSDRLSLGHNVGVARESEPSGSSTDLASATLSLGIGITDRVAAFVELFGDEPLDRDDREGSLSFDAGFTWLLSDTLQLDLAGGVGIDGVAADWFVGVGVSWRWPR